MLRLGVVNSSNPLYLSRALSGGWSATVPMMQGQAQPSPGPQAWFKSGERDPETNELLPLARTYTARFRVYPPPSTDNEGVLITAFDCVAWIKSVVAGNTITSKVSIGFETVITLTAESFSISIYDQTNPEFFPDGAKTYYVAVQVVPGERASYGTPPTLEAFTDQIDGAGAKESGSITLIATSGSARFPVPQDAGVVSVEVVALDATNPATATKVVVQAAAGAVVAKQWNPQINQGFVVLPPNTTYVIVENSSADAAFITLTWGIGG